MKPFDVEKLREFIVVQRGLAAKQAERRGGHVNPDIFDYYAGIEVAFVAILRFIGGYPEECRHQYRDRYGTPYPYCPWCGNGLLEGVVKGREPKT